MSENHFTQCPKFRKYFLNTNSNHRHLTGQKCIELQNRPIKLIVEIELREEIYNLRPKTMLFTHTVHILFPQVRNFRP